MLSFRGHLRIGVTAAAFLLWTALAFAAAFPPLSGRIVDAANLVDAATEARLTEKLAAFEKRSSDQIVIATIASLEGEAMEDYANRLFRHWKLGQAGEDNGALFLIVRDDRKMRIEVGYGLEGTLTDVFSGLIIDTIVVPSFRAGDFSGGIEQGTDQIIAVLSGDAAELEARAKRNAERPESGGIPPIVMLFIALWVTIIVGSIAIAILAPVYGRKIAPGRYRWLGMEFDTRPSRRSRHASGWTTGTAGGSGWSSGGSGGWSSGGGGFSGGGGSSGGGGASGGW